MKKIFFISFLFILINSVNAQNGPIYVVFTSLNSSHTSSDGIYKDTAIEYFNSQTDEYPWNTFLISGKKERNQTYSLWFIHRKFKNQPDQPVIEMKPKTFLNEIQYIDWDVLGPILDKTQAEQKYQEITSHDKIYFIDRNDFTDDSIKVIQVKKLELAKY